jgi:hypothetical protein
VFQNTKSNPNDTHCVDIKSNNMETIAAFLPSNSDEIQLKGRSGRYGMPGSFRMILNLNDKQAMLHGKTYNIANEVERAQKEAELPISTEEDVAEMYASFLESVHQGFLESYKNTPVVDKLSTLQDWQDFLGKCQKDWDGVRQKLMTYLDEGLDKNFNDEFTGFIDKTIKNSPCQHRNLKR